MIDEFLMREVAEKCRKAGVDPADAGWRTIKQIADISERKSKLVAEWFREHYNGGEARSTRRDSDRLKKPNPKHGSHCSETHDRTETEWTIDLPMTRLKTLEDVLVHCEVDSDVWEVERWVCNKWEVGMKPPAVTEWVENKRGQKIPMWVREDDDIVVEPLFQVKVWLIRKDAKKLRGNDSKVEFLKQFREILQSDSDFSFKTPSMRPFRPKDEDHSETVVALCSDLHLAETVRPDDANGVNVYNSIIAANRLWAHAQAFKNIVPRHMALYRIDKIWSPLLGDVLNGTIHEEYVATNDLSDPAAVVLGVRLLRMFYEELASLGVPIEIDAIHGNHARLTPKVPTKRQAHTNLDWLVYEMLADEFRDHDQIDVQVCTSQIGTKRIRNWNYVFEHGIDVKNGREEDFEDRIRALLDDPTFREATGYSGASFDQIIIGNMHKPKFLERTVVNGSYIGQNELGQSWRLKPIRAQQLMWGVSDSHVRTWQYAIDLTHVKTAAADNPFSEYATWFMKRHGQ